MRRFAGLLLPIMIVAGVVFWLERARLVSSLATRLLGQAGFSRVEVVVADLDSGSFSIDRLRLTAVVPGGILHLRLSGLYTTYRPNTVWKRKRLEQVTVRSAILEFQPRATTSTRETVVDLSGLRTLIRGGWLERLPLKYLHIDRLVFRGLPGLPPGNQVISLTARHDQGRLLADVALPSIRRNLHLSLASEQGLEVRLVLKSRYHPAVTLALQEVQGERLALVWQGNLEAVREWLAPLYPLTAIRGDFQGQATLPLRRPGSGLALTVDAGVDRLQLHGFGIGSLHLAGGLECTGKDNSLIRFGRNLQLDFQDLRHSTLHVRRISLGLAGRAEQHDGRWLVQLDPERDWQMTELTRGNLELAGVTVRPDLRLAREDKQWRLELGRDFFFQASGCRLDKFQADRVRLSPARAANLVLAAGSVFSWRVAPSVWQLDSTGGGREPWQIMADDPLEIRLDVLEGRGGGDWTVQAGISSPRLSTGGPFATTLTDIAATVHGDEKNLALELLFSPETMPGRLAADFALEMGSGRMQGRLRTLAPIVTGGDASLSTLVNPWPLPVELVEGELEPEVVFSRVPGRGTRLTARLGLTGARGTVGKTIQFAGLAMEQELRLVPGLSTLRPGPVRCEKIILPGRIELTGVEAFTELQNGKNGSLELVLENLRATLFNGLVTTPRINYTLDNRSADFVLTLRHFDLEEILRVYPVSDLQVRGRVGGLLPIHVRGSEVTVSDGRLVAEPPGGVIMYRPRSAEGADQGLTGITLRALRELHYRDLEIEVGYLPDGTLDLKFHFKGTSPELDTRRPVHLNINISQNLLSLLRSLRYTEEIDTEISRRVEQGYRNGQDR